MQLESLPTSTWNFMDAELESMIVFAIVIDGGLVESCPEAFLPCMEKGEG